MNSSFGRGWLRACAIGRFPLCLLKRPPFVNSRTMKPELGFRTSGSSWMTSPRAAIGVLAIGLAALICPAGGALALDYPTRPVRFVVGYPPGGATDILARLIGQGLSEKLGQQFVIENKPGAGNNIGTEMVGNAAGEGYSVRLMTTANDSNSP